MSILATQTNFLLHNTTNHFLEITISAEQDEEFRMMKQTSSNVVPGNTKVPMTIRCTSTLSFNTNIKSKQCSDIISGDFQLGPEYHGENLFIKWEPILGYGYDRKGNVTIGGNVPTHREMAINCVFEDNQKKRITGVDVTPACCKVAFN